MILGNPTAKGLEILNGALRAQVKQYALIGLATPDDKPLEELIARQEFPQNPPIDPDKPAEKLSSLEFAQIAPFIYHRGKIDQAYFDDEKHLTFEVDLSTLNTQSYVYACALLTDQDVLVAVIALPRVIINDKMGGLLVIKFSILGDEADRIIYMNRDFPSHAELDTFKNTLYAQFTIKKEQLDQAFDAKSAQMTQKVEQNINDLAQFRQRLNQEQETFKQNLNTEQETFKRNLNTADNQFRDGLNRQFNTAVDNTNRRVDEALGRLRNGADGLSRQMNNNVAQVNRAAQEAINRINGAGRVAYRPITIFMEGRGHETFTPVGDRPDTWVHFTCSVAERGVTLLCFNFKFDWAHWRLWPYKRGGKYRDEDCIAAAEETVNNAKAVVFTIPLTRVFVGTFKVYVEMAHYGRQDDIFAVDIL
ncbi:hypothetical protein [Helicobacter bizzozeronii]|uniref:hypothetical protein n=1 Tax=Helicobacter bizzozeronii TaxID=56877 RepID=UPI000CF0DE52|nr:hypothetical protein [Helicobacter bizzozeronii]